MPELEEKQYSVGVINPNSNKQLTSQLEERLLQSTQLTTKVTYHFLTNKAAAKYIETRQQLEESERALIQLVGDTSYDAVAIAGFVDPGIEILREKLKVPVIGMGSAALFAAASLGRFGIITVGQQAKNLTGEFIRKKGYSDYCVGISSLDSGVCAPLKGDVDIEVVQEKLTELVSAGAASICLGSGSLVPMHPFWQQLSSVPLINGFIMSLAYVAIELTCISSR